MTLTILHTKALWKRHVKFNHRAWFSANEFQLCTVVEFVQRPAGSGTATRQGLSSGWQQFFNVCAGAKRALQDAVGTLKNRLQKGLDALGAAAYAVANMQSELEPNS